jgi:acylphosphatase
MKHIADPLTIEAEAERLMDSWFPSYRRVGRHMTSSKLVNFFRDHNRYSTAGSNAARRIFDDKLVFSAFLAAIGINTPVSRWVVAKDFALNPAGRRMPVSALIPLLSSGRWFVKPRSGSGGRGAFMLDRGTVIQANGSVETTDRIDLLDHLKADKGFLVQDIVVQAGDYAVFSPSSLNTVRCLTYLGRSGKAEIAAASLRMGDGRSVVDNDGIYCGINLKTHRLLGPGLSDDKDSFAAQVFERHPISGVVLPGYEISRLDDVFAVCRLAHEALGGPMTVGWDVAMTDSGPCIMEGNLRWGAALHSLVDPAVKERLWAFFLRDYKLPGTGFPVSPRLRRDSLATVAFRLKGKVQGVGYRKWIDKLIEDKCLHGHARNRPNGEVEITLTGPLRALEFAVLAVVDGPSKAEISGIEILSLSGIDVGTNNARRSSRKERARMVPAPEAGPCVSVEMST